MKLTLEKLEEMIREELGSHETNGTPLKVKKRKARRFGKRTGKEDLENDEWIDQQTSGTVFEKMVRAALNHFDLVHKGMDDEHYEEVARSFAKGYLEAKDEFVD